MMTGARVLEIGMLVSSTGLAFGVVVLLLLGKLDVVSLAAIQKYGTILINVGTTIFLMCAAARLATWSLKK